MSECISVSQLQPGMVIVRITEQNGPVKIKKSGLVTSNDMIRGLSEMGVLAVEIDPEQTVELEAESVTAEPTGSTQTQALLKGQYDRQGHYDNQLADQFNRNLFLPSVQGIPSMWMVYFRQSLLIIMIVLLGGGVGFAGATYTLWWPLYEQSAPVVEQQAAPSIPTEIATGKPTQTVNTEPTESDTQPVPAQPVEETPRAIEEAEDDISEGTLLTQTPDDEPVQVSPEILRRFNQAVEALDNESSSRDETPQVAVRQGSDVQRIDQLPVRVMTTLPTMTFSAHMYASRPSDRWVRVNGLRLQEGDWIDDKVRIVNIEAQRVILEYQDEVFSMAALTDW
ncbi:DUF3391 domain-containing protein [Alteromonas sediminis]|uniref:DUF3391 domain-containing protein n=1 Tax=Alteromonas sediminis TaxID=2259342 RepID=A0A3N5Y469_9ALTE|nr:general secretion pathway protein GspB [Alteromonas sediminis]RPJ68260.1 DUF3391 domain-containing protein [Alteromonas sediminis]